MQQLRKSPFRRDANNNKRSGTELEHRHQQYQNGQPPQRRWQRRRNTTKMVGDRNELLHHLRVCACDLQAIPRILPIPFLVLRPDPFSSWGPRQPSVVVGDVRSNNSCSLWRIRANRIPTRIAYSTRPIVLKSLVETRGTRKRLCINCVWGVSLTQTATEKKRAGGRNNRIVYSPLLCSLIEYSAAPAGNQDRRKADRTGKESDESLGGDHEGILRVVLRIAHHLHDHHRWAGAVPPVMVPATVAGHAGAACEQRE
mmetsp:Transcript_9511/g.25833  ORF Transcript_9511/g.25833 Transcript_9511/m.25833 type:complete len:256 (-) Transcript_9511:1427-2194(-)